MAVRQITGCLSLINILNDFGHCISLSSTMAYDSALAHLSSNVIPRNFVAEEYVTLVYDNIDFGEEIAKQTHVTNGIITQKMAVQIENGLPHSTVIKKSQQTVEVPNCVIAENSLGTKKTPLSMKSIKTPSLCPLHRETVQKEQPTSSIWLMSSAKWFVPLTKHHDRDGLASTPCFMKKYH